MLENGLMILGKNSGDERVKPLSKMHIGILVSVSLSLLLGPVMVYQRAWVDEVSLILTALFVTISLVLSYRQSLKKKASILDFCTIILSYINDRRNFSLISLLMYCAFSALVTAVYTSNYLLLRWFVYFSSLAVILVFAKDYLRYLFIPKNLLFMMLLYFGLLALYVFAIDVVLGLTHIEFQAKILAGSTYSFFPIIAALHALMQLSWEQTLPRKITNISICLLILLTYCALAYDSRVGYLALISSAFFVIIFGHNVKLKIAFVLVATTLVIYILANHDYEYDLIQSLLEKILIGAKAVIYMLGDSASIYVDPRVSDLDRYTHMLCGLKFFINQDYIHVLFGYGQDMHKYELYKCIDPPLIVGTDLLADTDRIRRSTAFTAFIYDYGLIGSLLLLGLIFQNIWNIYKRSLQRTRNNPDREHPLLRYVNKYKVTFSLLSFYVVILLYFPLGDVRDLVFFSIMAFSFSDIIQYKNA